MGQVYRATDTKLKRQVAIKILPPSLAADHDRLLRFQREAEVLAPLCLDLAAPGSPARVGRGSSVRKQFAAFHVAQQLLQQPDGVVRKEEALLHQVCGGRRGR